MRFARSRGLALSEVIQMHPRDMDTWTLLDIQDHMKAKTDAGLAAAHEDLRARMGG